jgi:hypothetical protein
MKNLYQKIIRFFTTQTIPSQFIHHSPSFSLIEELEKQNKKEEEKRIKQLIRNEVRKQLNKKK